MEDFNLKIIRLSFLPLLLIAPLLQAGPILITGTPSNAYSLPPATTPSPNLGGALVNFDGLPSCQDFPPDSTCTNYSGTTFSGITISSPDGLYAIPFSSQSAPNELYDNSIDGSANITLSLGSGVGGIGVGIADSDTDNNGNPVNIFLQPLNSIGGDLGSAFEVTLPETGSNPGNGYFVVEDSIPDIFGLQITQPVGNQGVYTGLAIDDVQATPEPSSFLMLIGGVAMIGLSRLRKRS